MKSRSVLVAFTFGLLCLMMTSLTYASECSYCTCSPVGVGMDQGVILSQLTAHAPIEINSNSGFGALGFPGNGSESNPFLIENLEIVGSDLEDCINIGGSVTAYYEIRECRLSDADPRTGIVLTAGHGTVDTCEILNCGRGVLIDGGSHEIESSEIHNNTIGILAIQVDDVSLRHCTLYDNQETVFDEVDGISISESNFTRSGVSIGNSVGVTVNGNSFSTEATQDQLSVYGCNIGTISGNTFNINSLAGLRLQNSINLIVTNCEFVSSGPWGSLGIDSRGFEGMSDITIEGCTFESVECHAGYCETGLVVTDCTLTDAGILVVDSPEAEVSSNSITRGTIVVTDTCQDSLIFNNTLIGCSNHGIRIMENNTGIVVSSNSMVGAKISLRYGIAIESDGVVARLNEIENFDVGIHLSEADSCDIYNNTVFGNNIGIEIADGCSLHRVYYNILYGNTQNARDDGADNTWDDGIMLGNYWSNVGAPGEYAVPGAAGSVDRYAQPYVTDSGIPLQILLVASIAGVFVIFAAAFLKMRRK